MGVAHQRDGYQCGVWVCYMIDKWQEWNRSTTGATWESWIGLHGPPVGREATTSRGYREAMRGPIMARIGELEQRERHHVFHGEGETHDPISFEEGDDEIQEEAGAGPMQVGKSPTRQTQTDTVPKIPGHAQELPKVGEKRTRQTLRSPQATVESEEIRPRPNPPAQTLQGETSPRQITKVSLDDGRGTKWKGTKAQIMMLRTWVLAQLAKGDVRTGELFQHAAKIGYSRDAVRLMTTHLVSSEQVVWATHPPVNDYRSRNKWWRIDTMELSVGTGPTAANDPEVPEETEEEPQAVEASESTTILAVRTHWGSREYLLGPIRPQGEAWVEEDTLLAGGIAGINPSQAERETDMFHNKEREEQQARSPTEREPLSGTPTRHAHYWPGVTKLNIDTEPFNPDWDAAPSGKCTLTTETGRHHVFAHDERGKMVGALKEEVLDRLYDRYVAATGTSSTDQTHTRAGEERRRSFEEREPQLGTIHGFATEVVLLLKRYSCEEEEEVKKTALQNHWTLPPEIMQALQEAFGIQAEIFASPLNVHSHTATYCSKFDRDKIFGSKGSAWDTHWGELGAFEFNPEYTAADLDKALQEALMSTMAKTPVLGVGIYPAWTRTPAKAYCRRYGDTRIHEFGVIPRKSFTFLPPDHWGGTTVSGVTKKDYSNWGVRILVVANAEGWQKFCPDPEGAAELVGRALQRSTYCTVRKYHTIRNLRPANPRVHTSEAVSDMAAVKNAMENASQHDMIFDPHPMRKWEIPSMSRRQGWGNGGSEVPKEDRTPEAARAMRQTWRDRGLTEVTITEYHAANTAWPLDKIKEDSRARWLKAMERTPMLFSRQDRDRGHTEVRERFPTCPIKHKTRLSRTLEKINKAWDATSFLYTDGSRLDPEEEGGLHRVGAAYWDPRGDENPRTWRGTWSTGGHLTINRAELLAIHAALRARERTTPGEIAICTDSLCSMHQILNMLSRPHTMECHRHRDLLEDILSLVEQHNSQGTKVSLRKVKSHTGVKGNDKADEAAKQAAENLEGTTQIEPWDNRTMYTLVANARDGESMRPLQGEGAVERYVAERIALKATQHRSVRKWLQPPNSPWEEWGTPGRGNREGALSVEGSITENPTPGAPGPAQGPDRGQQDVEMETPGENLQELMLLKELQHAPWSQGDPPMRREPGDQEEQVHLRDQVTTQDEWDLLWEFDETRGPPLDMEEKGAMNSPEREMMQAIEEAECADPIDGLCRSMMEMDLGESKLQNLTDVPQQAIDAYQEAAPARRRKRNRDREAMHRGNGDRAATSHADAAAVETHMGRRVEEPPREILQDKSIPGISNHFWKVTPPTFRSLVLRCRFGVLMTAARKHLIWPNKYPDPGCALCGKRDTPAHRLAGCKDETSRNMATARHNEVARTLYEAIRKGRTGASPIWIAHHAGLDGTNRCTRPIPDFVLKRGQCRRDGRDHPGAKDPPDDIPHFVDIVMIKGAEDVRDAPPGRPENTRREDVGEIHLIEVAFTWDTHWYVSLHDKLNKYEPLMELLRSKGYKVFFHPMVFGTTGSVYEHNARALTQHLGFNKKEAEALLKKISSIAVEWAG
ncbi:hypothetical protein CYMTET_25594 [Cymbomonas tetramitiformis]|uniref:RNase H type-1 domain-containing protein n=1 Tax=Cymbomonas tetramitiformis TaxID=36881 RepID=A0AAE0FTW5_9CHLO|nr:hypothetical protein CYMTET_25594 [Cymbomonas tetramitiformis]